MAKIKVNYFEMMQTGVYRCTIDRMSLYDGDETVVRYSETLNNDGVLEVSKSENIITAISIVDMIKIINKGYSVIIHNKEKIKEIFEITFNHITACLDAKNSDLYGKYSVPDSDLKDMEDFLIEIFRANKVNLANLIKEEYLTSVKSSGMFNKFSMNTNTHVAEQVNGDPSFIRRVSKDEDELSIADLLDSL